MLEEFKKHIDINFNNLKENHFLLACSGGVDSVVLVYLCRALNLNFSIAHCNFQLREKESDIDEDFVRKLAKKQNVGIHVTKFKTVDYMNLNKVTLQVGARELRYDWFNKIMAKYDIPTLVTAHHSDDNLETFIINLSRGTGVEGLTSIPEKTGFISRPLLYFSQDQILAYAKENAIEWREDKSNQETKYLRNKIRHKIVPLLKELHPTFLRNFSNTQSYLGETAQVLEQEIKKAKAFHFIKEGAITKINIESLNNLNPKQTYIYHFFKEYGFVDVQAVIDLMAAMTGKELLSSTHRLLKDRNYLLLQELSVEGSEVYFIQEGEKEIEIPVQLKIELISNVVTVDLNTIYTDVSSLKFPLIVRKWKFGDYFHPFGMKGVKKLSKFYKDEKYSRIAKEEQWLLCSEDNIVWVIGKRFDNRFRVTNQTKNILKFTVK
ncbi:tRNA lysidine(34) synthetase TilS [Cellulophaga sp. HaHaR_3_176]|uniref:tRNA lysidine(34) synthetase TilS n=1 Tax=Cellulophaga sp. HaHaR_3_176 TaxID=1942464 RepID=UPI001C1FF831|nr:tRNA lysidine(34) synthetase TilS [Cellulophaga sp. HaHaR_3_176]QWX85060.1 tRNA lysidine(34) synthetase TilS [Cellulophaga sp. HaHaR_3_176]